MRKILETKGDATDILFFGIIIFFLAVSFTVVLFVNDLLSNVVRNTVLNQSQASDDILRSFDNINSTVTQRGFVLMFALLIVGLMISGFLVRVHPIFIFIYIFTLVMAVIDAVYLTNLYQAIIENSQFASISENYTMITYIMQNAVKIIIAVGLLSMLITFAKLVGGGGGGSPGGDI